ncbi:hypothetical protein PRZ48_011286 [Zasmidium cellare]|uniref:Major facilitator superfamily (MFS) profile domain-containing protein n=1 Tax=Zasmidium cellare TaxID=395010 RepID=A0ABR0E5Z5_ZASCE|nr:hypothetical protein PRZ48_011286 [Zasmidium cellare]
MATNDGKEDNLPMSAETTEQGIAETKTAESQKETGDEISPEAARPKVPTQAGSVDHGLICWMQVAASFAMYWQVVLAQGLVVGLGCGLLFIPATGILPQYLVKKRALASLLAAAGSGFGGLIYPIIFRELQPNVGFGWAVRVIAFITLFVGIISNVLGRNKVPPGKPRKIVDMGFFKETALVLVSAGAFFVFMGLFILGYYIGVYALDLRITGNSMAFYLVALMQGSSLVSRVVLSPFADKIGPLNIAIAAVFMSSILTFCWIAIKSEAGLIVFAVLYGCCFGIFLGMAPPAYISLMKGDIRKFGVYLAMGFLITSPGILIGNQISGAILRDDHTFVGLQAFAGALLFVGGCLMISARWASVGWKLCKV